MTSILSPRVRVECFGSLIFFRTSFLPLMTSDETLFAHRPRIPEEKDCAECSGPSTEPGRDHDQPERGAAQP